MLNGPSSELWEAENAGPLEVVASGSAAMGSGEFHGWELRKQVHVYNGEEGTCMVLTSPAGDGSYCFADPPGSDDPEPRTLIVENPLNPEGALSSFRMAVAFEYAGPMNEGQVMTGDPEGTFTMEGEVVRWTIWVPDGGVVELDP